MDFAIIKTGGKQYKVKTGDVLKVETISGAPKDGKVEFDDILFNKKVKASIVGEGRHAKVRVLKFHPKKRYKRVAGHRQQYNEIKIDKIE